MVGAGAATTNEVAVNARTAMIDLKCMLVDWSGFREKGIVEDLWDNHFEQGQTRLWPC